MSIRQEYAVENLRVTNSQDYSEEVPSQVVTSQQSQNQGMHVLK